MGAPQWLFEPFRLDPVNARLWRGAEVVALQPRVFDVLHYLVTHPNRLVTKDELLDAVWPETAVSEAVVRVAIGALRKALDDTTQTPRFIATVLRRGYRFMAAVTEFTPPAPTPPLPSPPRPLLAPPLLVEREAVLQHLHAAWQQARQGVRQVVFVTGEAGLGKTAVVETLAAYVRTDPTVGLATGQCVEHYGTGEAYLPILEVLGSLCQGPRGADLVALVRQHAPTWLVQMPWLLTAADRESLQYELQGTTRERMLREFAAVVEALTAAMPLLLVLEDLHWSDYATVDLLAMLARQCPHARLLVVGTYRPVETLVQQHPLPAVTLDLQRHESTTVWSLAALSAEAVASYLAARFPQHQFPTALAVWLHQRTDGHPLFLATLVQALVERGVLCTTAGGWTMPVGLDALNGDVPERLRQLLQQQILRLPRESQRVLEVASVAGVEFVAAAVAVGLEADADAVEECCEALVAQELLCPLSVTTWPNGVVATRYAFRHELYQQVVYQGLGAGKRVRLHQRLGGYLEAAYGAQAGEIAAELAEHFVRGQDTQHAVLYLRQAAENAAQRYAQREVIDLLTRALALLQHGPETPERLVQELAIQRALGSAWMALKGFAVPEAGHAYTCACTLACTLGQCVGDTSEHFQAVYGVWLFALVDGTLPRAQALAEQLLDIAETSQEPSRLLVASWALSTTCFHQGNFVQAQTHAQRGKALYDRAQHGRLAAHYVFDPGVVCGALGAITLGLRGAPDQAQAWISDALGLAQALAFPLSMAFALATAVLVHQLRREPQAVSEYATALITLCTAHGPALYLAMGTLLQGWARAAQGQAEEALVQMRQGLIAMHATGTTKAWQPSLLTMLAEVAAQAGQPEEGVRLLAEAQIMLETTGERFWEAEVYRLRGDLLWRGTRSAAAQAETCYLQALHVARQQQAKSWELRAATSLARLWQQQGKYSAAQQLLAEVYGWFTEGFDTADLQEARTLLEDLGTAPGRAGRGGDT